MLPERAPVAAQPGAHRVLVHLGAHERDAAVPGLIRCLAAVCRWPRCDHDDVGVQVAWRPVGDTTGTFSGRFSTFSDP